MRQPGIPRFKPQEELATN